MGESIKEKISESLKLALGSGDLLLHGMTVLTDATLQPFYETTEDDLIQLMLCRTEDFAVGDRVYYLGPSIAEYGLKKGSICTLRSNADVSGKVSITGSYSKVHISHLGKSGVVDTPIPGGYTVGDEVCYKGPVLQVHPSFRSRVFCGGAVTIRPGMLARVLEAGVLQDSVRLVFQ